MKSSETCSRSQACNWLALESRPVKQPSTHHIALHHHTHGRLQPARLTRVPRDVQYQTTSTPTPYSWTKGTAGSVMEE